MGQGHNGFPNILGLLRATSLKVLGQPGATAGASLVGGTTSGAPTSGTFEAGAAVVAQNGHLWICTVAGSPGTWVDAGASGGYTDPLTTRGDLLVRGAASTARLPLGTSGYVLTSDGTDAAWAAAGAGFADPMSTRGDLIVRGGSGTTRLALGSSGQYLKSDGTDALWGAAPALVQIAQQTLGSAATNITLSSIPGTYSQLVLDVVAASDQATTAQGVSLQLNTDTGSNYDYVGVYTLANGSPSTEGGAAGTSAAVFAVPGTTAPANAAAWVHMVFPGYAQTTFRKGWTTTYMRESGTSTSGLLVEMLGGVWRSTAAITSIKLFPGTGNFVAGSSATLYGCA